MKEIYKKIDEKAIMNDDAVRAAIDETLKEKSISVSQKLSSKMLPVLPLQDVKCIMGNNEIYVPYITYLGSIDSARLPMFHRGIKIIDGKFSMKAASQETAVFEFKEGHYSFNWELYNLLTIIFNSYVHYAEKNKNLSQNSEKYKFLIKKKESLSEYIYHYTFLYQKYKNKHDKLLSQIELNQKGIENVIIHIPATVSSLKVHPGNLTVQAAKKEQIKFNQKVVDREIKLGRNLCLIFIGIPGLSALIIVCAVIFLQDAVKEKFSQLNREEVGAAILLTGLGVLALCVGLKRCCVSLTKYRNSVLAKIGEDSTLISNLNILEQEIQQQQKNTSSLESIKQEIDEESYKLLLPLIDLMQKFKQAAPDLKPSPKEKATNQPPFQFYQPGHNQKAPTTLLIGHHRDYKTLG